MSKILSTLNTIAAYNNNRAFLTGWCLCSGTKDDDILVGYDINTLIDNLYGRLVYIQDINVISSYIVSYLVENEYAYVDDRYSYMSDRKKHNKTKPCWWSMIRSSKGEVYTLFFSSYGRDCEIRSSRAILLNSVKAISKDWDLQDCISDDMLQYWMRRPDDKDMDNIVVYCQNLYKIIVEMRKHGKQLTAASNASKDWIRRDRATAMLLSVQLPDDIDKDIRNGYRGGIVWNRKDTIGIELGSGYIVDMHSIYGYVEKNFRMPVGIPKLILGLADEQEDKIYFYKYKVTGQIKEHGIACISDQGNHGVGDTCLEVIQDKELVLTKYDLELLVNNYDLSICEPVYTYEFDTIEGMFNNFVDFWYDKKKHSIGSDRIVAKGNLVTNYGWLGRKDMIVTVPKIIDGCLRWVHCKDDNNKILKIKPKWRYVPVPAMITSIARWLIVNCAIEASKECDVVAIDTDALHCIGNKPNCLSYGNELGQFGIEAKFDKIKHLGPKQYGYKDGLKYVFKMSGATDRVKEKITWDTFYKGSVIEQSRAYPKGLEGGVIREYRDYII